MIPAYNVEAYLRECLDSVFGQDVAQLTEVLVVDDGSQDRTPEIASGYLGVSCLRQQRQGPAAARNSGIGRARGELVAFLDADDLWPPGSLRRQLAILAERPEAGLVFGDCRQFDASGPYARTLFEEGGYGVGSWGDSGLVPNAYGSLLRADFITTGSVVARRTAIEAVGGFDETLRLVEDLDLWLRIACRYPIAWNGAVCLLRRRHGANLSAPPEPMSLAYLGLLRRHEIAHGAEIARMGVSLGRLRADEYCDMTKRAMRDRRFGAGIRWAQRAVAAEPTPGNLLRVLKTAAAAALDSARTAS